MYFLSNSIKSANAIKSYVIYIKKKNYSNHIIRLILCTQKTMGLVLGTTSNQEVDMSSPKAIEVLDIIKKDRVVIFSKSYCPYCVMAKEQFQKLSFPYIAIELDKRDDGDEMQNILQNLTGARTVPRVFVSGVCIGGGTDVKAMYSDGSLKKLLDSPAN